MFLSLLEEHQKVPFLELAQMVIQADGKVAPEEAGLLEVMKKEMNVNALPVSSNRPLQEIARAFNTKRAKYVAAFELIGLGYADNEFVASEKDVLMNLFKHFNLPEADLVSIENWVVRQLAMVREAEKHWRDE